ncbi:MAG: insulinase family protein, partial [Planctomycetota bacterium]
MPLVHTEHLDAGITLLIEPMPSVRSAAITFAVPAGLTSEPNDRLGTASVMSEVLMRGGSGMDSRTLADAFDHAGCTRSISAGTRSMTFRGTTIGDRLGEGIELFSNVIRGPRVEDATVEPAKSLSLQTLDSLSDEPRQRASIELRRRHMPDPYNRSNFGERAGIGALTTEELAEWWQNRAVPGGTIIGVAGSVDPARVIDQINVVFDGWKGSVDDIEPEAEPVRGPGHIDDDSNQVQVLAMFEVPNERDEHSAIREKEL